MFWWKQPVNSPFWWIDGCFGMGTHASWAVDYLSTHPFLDGCFGVEPHGVKCHASVKNNIINGVKCHASVKNNIINVTRSMYFLCVMRVTHMRPQKIDTKYLYFF